MKALIGKSYDLKCYLTTGVGGTRFSTMRCNERVGGQNG